MKLRTPEDIACDHASEGLPEQMDVKTLHQLIRDAQREAWLDGFAVGLLEGIACDPEEVHFHIPEQYMPDELKEPE